MKELDLFSGVGGFALGLEWAGMKTIAMCEIEEFCRKVLRKHWSDVPIAKDIRNLKYEKGILYEDEIPIYAGPIDIVAGGFPCQPFSVAGKRRGQEDDRDLWPEMFRVIQEVRPRWVIGENVAGFVNMGLDRTLSDLEGMEYETQTFIIPACAIGAPHRRDRTWIIAHTTGNSRNNGLSIRPAAQKVSQERFDGICSDVAHSNNPGLERGQETRGNGSNRTKPANKYAWGRYWGGSQHWTVEPDVGRVAHGVPQRVDRLKGLGNAVVPQIPEIIGRAIMEIENANPQNV